MIKIFAELKSGEIILCFSWIGSEASGIERAKKDAAIHGVECVRFWGE